MSSKEERRAAHREGSVGQASASALAPGPVVWLEPDSELLLTSFGS